MIKNKDLKTVAFLLKSQNDLAKLEANAHTRSSYYGVSQVAYHFARAEWVIND